MLDIKLIRENPQDVKDRLLAKEADCGEAIDRIIALDALRRELIAKSESDKAEQNRVSKRIPEMKKAGEDPRSSRA